MEGLRELNRICQKKDYKKIGNWMVRHILRDAALPFTWVLLHTPITANQVTALSILFIIGSALLFSIGTVGTFFAGAVLLQAWYLMDHIDGQIARYRKQESVTGIFLDYISHYFPHLLIFPFISIGLFRNSGELIYIYVGITSAAFLSLINLIFDCKYKSFFWGVSKYGCTKIDINAQQDEKAKVQGNKKSKTETKAKTAFSWLYKCCEIHVIMNILLFLSILIYTPLVDFKNGIRFLLIFYALVAGFVFTLRLTYYVVARRIEADFFNTFKR